ncbi:VWA domain-containing protein, partial [Singulisphaera rosea]
GGTTRIAGQGVAIVVALDQSSSMKAVDFASRADASAVSRLDAAKETFSRFVSGRPDDLIGLVVFANYPDPACPTTLDHARLLETVRTLRYARPGDDGTNLGDAIILGLGLLRETSPKKKVLILLTDGHNSPAVPRPNDPELAARLARELGITLHTIAIGQGEGVLRGVEPVTGLDLVAQVDAPDFELLKRLAKLGGGQAFAAADVGSLDQVFKKIDNLEKSPVQSMILTRYREHFAPWAAAALILLVVDRSLVKGWLRSLP